MEVISCLEILKGIDELWWSFPQLQEFQVCEG